MSYLCLLPANTREMDTHSPLEPDGPTEGEEGFHLERQVPHIRTALHLQLWQTAEASRSPHSISLSVVTPFSFWPAENS